MTNDIYANTKVQEISPKDLSVSGSNLKLKDDNNEKAIVKFYAPWCGFCTKLKGLLSKLADEGYKIYAINCDKYKKQIEKITEKTDIKIQGYPSIFIKGKDNVLKEYSGDRSEGDFKKHLKNQSGGGGYNFIYNPNTNRKVRVNSKKGQSIIRNYLKYLDNF
jgi:thiol-disulfide isomerase/thioredoxin